MNKFYKSLFFISIFFYSGSCFADGNGTLGNVLDLIKCGLNYTSASQRLGQRFSPAGVAQPAGFVISGIPPCANIEKAYLWAEGSGDGTAQTATIDGPSGTQNFPMSIVGQGPDKCWSYVGSSTYRADVTSVVTGNGTYNISGLLTNPPNTSNDMDGATLMVIYSDPTVAYQGRIVIADGSIVVGGGTANYNLTYPAVCGSTTNASAFSGVGDLQANPGSWSLNGTAVAPTWNWWNYVQTTTTVTNGQTSSNFNLTSSGDCFNYALAGIYFQTTTCATCTTPTIAITTSGTDATCSSCNGTASVTSATAGYGPNTFTYSWAPSGGTNATATGLCAGTYTVTVSNGCLTGTATVTVNTTGSVSVSGTQTNASCYGQCDGSATVSATGGTLPYAYSWAPSGGNGATATGLCAGNYTCTVTSANGCTGTKTFSITQPPQLTASISAVKTSVCYGQGTTINFSGTPNAIVTYNTGGPNQTVTLNGAGTASISTGALAGNVTYTLVSVQLAPCTASVSGSVTITVNPLPVFSAGMPSNNGPICSGNVLDLFSSTTPASTGYSWTGPAFGVPNTAQNPVINNAPIADAGTYTVTATDANGCSVTGTTTVVIYQTPAITIVSTSNPTTCGGNQGTIAIGGLTPNGSYTLYYSTPTAVSTSITANGAGQYTISGLPAGTYSNIYVSQNNCLSNTLGPVTLTDPAPPQITSISSSSPTTCNGTQGTITLSGLLPNTVYTVHYFDNATPQTVNITSNVTGQIIITGLAAGVYSNVTVSINNCTSTAVGPFVLVDPAAPVVTASNNSPICEGQILDLFSTVTFNGNPVTPSSISWTGPAFATPNAQQNPTVANAVPAYSGTYTVVATYANCSSQPATTGVTVNPAPAIPIMSSNSPVCSDSDLVLTVNTIAGASDYHWTGPNGLSLHQQNATITDAQTINAGTYTLSVTSNNNCGLLAPATIDVVVNQTPGTPTVQDIAYCQGETAPPLTATPSGNATDVIKWYTQATGGTGSATAPVPSTSIPGAYTWYVSQETAAGCEGLRVPQVVTIKVKPATPIIIAAQHYCEEDSNVGPFVAMGDSVRWYTTPSGGVGTYTAPTPSTDTPGSFTWYATQTVNGCESDRQPVTITVNAKPPVPVTVPVNYCLGDAAMPLTATAQFQLNWYDMPTGGAPLSASPVPPTDTPSVRTWYVSQTANFCESDRAAITVTVLYRPTANIIASNNEVCQEDSLTFSYSGNAQPSTTYAWTWPTGSTVLSGTGPGPYVVRFDNTGIFTVSVIATDSICSSPAAIDTVKVKQTPELAITFRNNIVCVGDMSYLDIAWVNMELESYLWDFGGGHVSNGNNTATGKGPYYVTWGNAGKYIVKLNVSAKDGCSATASDTVDVHPYPEAKISTSAIEGLCAGQDIVLTASVNNSKYTYLWTPREFFDYDYNSPVVTAHADKSQYISLKVTNEYGCQSMDSIMIETKPCCELLLPNAFSPNGDGKNDLFRILNPGRHKLVSLRVLNRYGEVVFETADEHDGWNGSLNGTAQEMGVYFYQVKYLCDGKEQYLKGDVTLVR